ncbi:uncharacterized protein [Amphiura filiformis]|uniref:uncharacterized protein n=1 Tax=Amphiura filiformis TaxID=82378 RepID=UPI003B214970
MPDAVRFEMKNDTEYLFGIADDSSFMSSFAIKAQFPEYDEKKDRRKRNKNKNKNGGQDGRSKTTGYNQDKRPQTDRRQYHQDKQPSSGNTDRPESNKYPGLVSNMQGLYSVAVHVGGAPSETAKNVELLFRNIGPIAGKSSYGNLLFFRFENVHHAETVIDEFNGFVLGGFKLKVDPAKEKKHDGQSATKISSQNVNVSTRPQQQQQQHNHQQQQWLPQQQEQQQHQQLSGNKIPSLEEKITELNSALLNRMQGPNNDHVPMHHGKVQNTYTPVNMVKDGTSEHTQNKRHNFQHQPMPNSTSRSSTNSHQNHDAKYSNSKGGSKEGQRANSSRHQRKCDDDMCSIKVSSIANSLLEKDVRSFMEPYHPETITFLYPKGRHTCYSAIVLLKMTDAERAIQSLNGKVKYDTPLSVKPYTMRPKKPRTRNQSEGSSVTESASSSVTVDDGEPAKVDGSGDFDDGPMPSLADFADRFSNITI